MFVDDALAAGALLKLNLVLVINLTAPLLLPAYFEAVREGQAAYRGRLRAPQSVEALVVRLLSAAGAQVGNVRSS